MSERLDNLLAAIHAALSDYLGVDASETSSDEGATSSKAKVAATKASSDSNSIDFSKLPSAGEAAKMRRAGITRVVKELNLPINLDDSRKVSELREDLVAFINKVAAPPGTTEVSPAESGEESQTQPASASAPPAAPIPPPPVPPDGKVENEKQSTSAEAASPPVAPPAQQTPAAPAPVPVTPAPAAPAPAPAVAPEPAPAPAQTQSRPFSPEQITQFKQGLAKIMQPDGGVVAKFWTGHTLEMANQLSGFLQQAATQGDPEHRPLFEKFFQKYGCKGNCKECPIGPHQVALCYALFETEVPGISCVDVTQDGVEAVRFPPLPEGAPRYGEEAMQNGYAFHPEQGVEEFIGL